MQALAGQSERRAPDCARRPAAGQARGVAGVGAAARRLEADLHLGVELRVF